MRAISRDVAHQSWWYCRTWHSTSPSIWPFDEDGGECITWRGQGWGCQGSALSSIVPFHVALGYMLQGIKTLASCRQIYESYKYSIILFLSWDCVFEIFYSLTSPKLGGTCHILTTHSHILSVRCGKLRFMPGNQTLCCSIYLMLLYLFASHSYFTFQ